MKLTKLAIALALGMAAIGTQTGYAAGPDERALHEMLQKSSMIRADGTVSRADFMKMMEKRFDALDKGRRGALTPEEIKRLLDAATPI